MPTAPDLGRSEHATTATHVSEGSLALVVVDLGVDEVDDVGPDGGFHDFGQSDSGDGIGGHVTFEGLDSDKGAHDGYCGGHWRSKASLSSQGQRGPGGPGHWIIKWPNFGSSKNIIAPEFYIDKVKEGEIVVIEIDKDLRSLSADIISRACFGSNYTQGEEIFLNLRTLEKIMSKRPLGIPGLRFLPSKTNRQIWKLEKEIDSMIVKVVKQRMETSYEKDLLQMLLEGAKNSGEYNSLCSDSDISCDKFVMDNCKNIYIAGHETVALTASWCLMLLAAYPEWQDRARAEVLEICKDGIPDADML
ncbi:hypothetical protein SO802_008992 [Lithocarpus litseifolius]|uniref:Uncharacterized protein n=1 Tax=Lithocarpus litseifolius TaxID=425828 RepID=A0AAW2DE10_9ROSI